MEEVHRRRPDVTSKGTTTEPCRKLQPPKRTKRCFVVLCFHQAERSIIQAGHGHPQGVVGGGVPQVGGEVQAGRGQQLQGMAALTLGDFGGGGHGHGRGQAGRAEAAAAVEAAGRGQQPQGVGGMALGGFGGVGCGQGAGRGNQQQQHGVGHNWRCHPKNSNCWTRHIDRVCSL